jgi:hypothetical protein
MRTSQHEIQHADGYSAVCLNYYSGGTKLYCTELWYVYFCTSLHVSQPNSLVMAANIRVHRLSNNGISCGPTQMRTAQISNMQQM